MSGFVHPLAERYASRRMLSIFSPQNRYRAWRKAWLALMVSEREAGVPIPEEAIAELEAHLDPTEEELETAKKLERETRHDVVAHIRSLAARLPKAGRYLHLGATSAFVTDNADLMLMREALQLVAARLATLLGELARFATRWADLPCISYTHFQPAQPTTVGKRACLWAHDFLMDLKLIEFELSRLAARGAKGTVGTQASYLELLGSPEKVRQMDLAVAKKLGFEKPYAVTGQTYPRKVDFLIASALSSVAQSAHKMATDIRLLSSTGELSEAVTSSQVGSSAMPYKKNPTRCERICSLARWVINAAHNAADTAACQWLERSLDDSANRRMLIPEVFLATDAVLILATTVIKSLQVNTKEIEKKLKPMLPLLLSEAIIAYSVRRGADRQVVHERLRRLSRLETKSPDAFLKAVTEDPEIPVDKELISSLLSDPKRLTGMASEQVEHFVDTELQPVLAGYEKLEVQDPGI